MVDCRVPQQRRSRPSVTTAIALHRGALADVKEHVLYGGGGPAASAAAFEAEADALMAVATARCAHGPKSFALKARYLIGLSRIDDRDLERLIAIRIAAEMWLRERDSDRDEGDFAGKLAHLVAHSHEHDDDLERHLAIREAVEAWLEERG